jgi:hypothetical protein
MTIILSSFALHSHMAFLTSPVPRLLVQLSQLNIFYSLSIRIFLDCILKLVLVELLVLVCTRVAVPGTVSHYLIINKT